MKILVIVEEGFEELEAMGPIALLRRAGVIVDIATKGKTSQISSHKVTLSNLLDFNKLDNKLDYDMLFIPGGSHWNQILNDMDYKNLATYYFNNKKISAVCAAPTVLGRWGLLKGRNYTCFTSMNDDFGGTYLDQYVVKDGNLITGRSVAASIELGLAMMLELLGKEKTNEIKKQIYY